MKAKRKQPDQVMEQPESDEENFNTIEFKGSGFNKYHKTDIDYVPKVIQPVVA